MKINGFCVQKCIHIIQINFWFINLLMQVARLGIKDLKSILFLSLEMRHSIFILPFLHICNWSSHAFNCLPPLTLDSCTFHC